MNRENIIRMANESNLLGIYADEAIDSVIRFAALIASAERESLRESFRVVTAAEASAAILHEREACAKVCEETTASWTQHLYNEGCIDCAKAIRARGQA